MRKRLLLVAALVAVAGSGAAAQQQAAPIVVAIEDAQYKPLDPARPGGTAIAVLRGDPATGPSTMLMKFRKTDGAVHAHTAGYHAVLLSGEAMHYEKCTCEAAGVLKPGSYWYQPGGATHGDACLSDECVIFLSWEGPRDVIGPPAPPAEE
jgi:Domain of unknown function (DUF4437)